MDGAGAAYVTGETFSDESTFPIVGGPDPTYGGSGDAFIAKVRPDGTGLEFSGYVGGTDDEEQPRLDLDASGAAYVAGLTRSSVAEGFPASFGPDLVLGGSQDAFIAKVQPNGSGFVYAGYIGGTDFDEAVGVGVDGVGAAYVVGETESDPGVEAFPATVGPDTTYDPGPNDEVDGFIAKVQPNGSGFAYAGYIGGSDFDRATGVAVDGTGAAYVVGTTQSDQPAEGFPAAVGPDTTYSGPLGAGEGEDDGFIAKVQANGSGFAFAGYIGGADFEDAESVAVDASGAAYVVGETNSTHTLDAFPAHGGPDNTFNGGSDAYVAKVFPDGTGFEFLGYLGGLKFDEGVGVALDVAGGIYVTGETDSDDTFPLAVGPDTIPGGIGSLDDAWVTKLIEVACKGKAATLAGTQGANTIPGTNGNDVIAALGGNDKVNAKGGKDLVCGGAGNDRLNGGSDNDRLLGEKGKDRLIGGTGRDVCVGGPKKDRAACEKERTV